MTDQVDSQMDATKAAQPIPDREKLREVQRTFKLGQVRFVGDDYWSWYALIPGSKRVARSDWYLLRDGTAKNPSSKDQWERREAYKSFDALYGAFQKWEAKR